VPNATVQRLLHTENEMDDLKLKRQNINDKLNELTVLERCEFEKRLRAVTNLKLSKRKLIKQHNDLQQENQAELKERNKTEIKFVLIVAAVALINYFIDTPKSDEFGYLWVIIISAFVTMYEIKKRISDSEFIILYRNYDFEIDKVGNEINQYGYFLTSDADLFYEYDGSNESFKNKFVEKTTKARIELEIEILKFMNLQVKSTNGN
jgi:hypothetical protein